MDSRIRGNDAHSSRTFAPLTVDPSNSLFHKEKWIPTFAGMTLRSLTEACWFIFFRTLHRGSKAQGSRSFGSSNGGGVANSGPDFQPRHGPLHLWVQGGGRGLREANVFDPGGGRRPGDRFDDMRIEPEASGQFLDVGFHKRRPVG